MQRVLVIGPSGAGKTTLARKIASRHNLPHYDLDYYHWRPGWTAAPKEEWRATAERLAATPKWVMSGNYGGSFDIRMPRGYHHLARFSPIAMPRKNILAHDR